MTILHLPDGSIEFIDRPADFVELISDRIGQDAAELLEGFISSADRATQEVGTDLRAYEMTLERYHSGLSDIGDMVGELSSELEASRINKGKLRQIIDRIDTEICNHL